MTMTEQQRRQYLHAMGIPIWQQQESNTIPSLPGNEVGVTNARHELAATETEMPDNLWHDLEQRVTHCEACVLHQHRTQSVLGVGNRQADWMVIGEAPGADEDRQGEPFVGRAGKLLNAMLYAAGFERPDVYISNIVKCRPPQNRDPRPEEAERCSEYLHKQIAWVQPRLILSVGRISAQSLLQSSEPVGHLRGKVHYWGTSNIPLVVTYHPAYLLRSPLEKKKAWDDLKLALSVCGPTSH